MTNLYRKFTTEATGSARASLGTHRDPEEWRRLVLNGMAEDFSWEHQAERYLAIYRRLLIH